MKRFAFTLQRILAFKRTLYNKERNTLARMRAERAAVQMRREETERQIRQKDAEFYLRAEHGVARHEMSAHALYRDSAARLINELVLDLARRAAEIERQLQVVVELDKEVKSLEKLRETQWEAYGAETRREEQQRILEIVSGRFAQRQKQAAPQ